MKASTPIANDFNLNELVLGKLFWIVNPKWGSGWDGAVYLCLGCNGDRTIWPSFSFLKLTTGERRIVWPIQFTSMTGGGTIIPL